jgi:hypothetical protein
MCALVVGELGDAIEQRPIGDQHLDRAIRRRLGIPLVPDGLVEPILDGNTGHAGVDASTHDDRPNRGVRARRRCSTSWIDWLSSCSEVNVWVIVARGGRGFERLESISH